MADAAIEVAVRIRPVSKSELKKGLSDQWTVANQGIYLSDQIPHEIFTFDYILDTNSNNNDLYNVVKPLVQTALNGVNATIFAYGQTSSGKTHSIMGDRGEPGIIPQAVHDIFATIQNNPDNKYVLRVSYVEIYNEKINDLLNTSNRDIRIREDTLGNIFVKSEEVIVADEARMLEVIQSADKRRQIGETRMNDKSSRSHVLCDITIESSAIDDEDGAVKVSHLYIVDLAGSERISATKATGVRMNEGVHINLSLSTLINVITQLSNGCKFVNFRDSKLTRMLSNALGGNSRTLILCTITPVSVEDSVSTLRFAARAKTIKTKPRINELRSDQSVIKKLQRREKQLTDELQREKENNMKNLDMRMQLEAEMNEIRSKFVTKKIEIKSRLPMRRHTLGAAAHEHPLTPIPEFAELTSSDIETQLSVDDLPINERKSTEFEDYKDLYDRKLQECQHLTMKYNHLETSYAQWKEFDKTELEVELEARTIELSTQNQKLEEMKRALEAEIDITKASLMKKYEGRCHELQSRISELEKALSAKDAPAECDAVVQGSMRLIEGRSRYLWEEEMDKEAPKVTLRRSSSDPQLATLPKETSNKLFQDISTSLRKLFSIMISDEDSDVRNCFANKLCSIADGNPNDALERLNALLMMEQKAFANEEHVSTIRIKQLEERQQELEFENNSLTEKCSIYEQDKNCIDEEKVRLEENVKALEAKFAQLEIEHELFVAENQSKASEYSEKVKILDNEKQHWEKQAKEHLLDVKATQNQLKSLQNQFDHINSENKQFSLQTECLSEQIASLERDLRKHKDNEESLQAECNDLRNNQAIAKNSLREAQDEQVKSDKVIREQRRRMQSLEQRLKDLDMKLSKEAADNDMNNIDNAILKEKSQRILSLEEELKELRHRSRVEAERLALTMQDSEEMNQNLEKTIRELKAQLRNAEEAKLKKTPPSGEDSEELQELIKKLQEDLQTAGNVITEKEDALLMAENDLQQSQQSLKNERLAKEALERRQYQENVASDGVKEMISKLEEHLKESERKAEQYMIKNKALNAENDKVHYQVACSEQLINNLRTELDALKKHEKVEFANDRELGLEASNKLLTAENDKISQDIKELVVKLRNENDALKNNASQILQSAKEESRKLANDLSTSEQVVNKLTEEIEALKKRQEVSGDASAEEEIIRLRNECNSLTRNWHSARDSIQWAKQSLAKGHAKEMAAKQKEMEKLQDALAQQKARDEKLNKAYCDLKRDYSSLKCVSQDQKWQLAALIKKLKEREEDCTVMEEESVELTCLKEKMSKMQEEYLSLAQSQRSKDELIQKLRQELNSDKENQRNDANNVNADEQAEACKLKSELKETQERVNQLSTAKSQVEDELIRLGEKFARVQAELQEERKHPNFNKQEICLHLNRYREERNQLRNELDRANETLTQTQSVEEMQRQRKEMIHLLDANNYRKRCIEKLTKENEDLRKQSKEQQSKFHEHITKLKNSHSSELKKLEDKLNFYVPSKYEPEHIIFQQKIAAQSVKMLQVLLPITELLTTFNMDERWTITALCMECEVKLKATNRIAALARGVKDSFNFAEMLDLLQTKNLQLLYDTQACLDPLLSGISVGSLKLHVRNHLESTSEQIKAVQQSLSACYKHFTDIQEGFDHTQREFNVKNSNVANCPACSAVSVAYELTVSLDQYLSNNIQIIDSFKQRCEPVDVLGVNMDQLDAKLGVLVKRFNDSSAVDKLSRLEERHAKLKNTARVQDSYLQKLKETLIREDYEINLQSNPIVITKRTPSITNDEEEMCFASESNPRPVFERHREREHTGRKSLGGRIPRHLDLVFGQSEELAETSRKRTKD